MVGSYPPTEQDLLRLKACQLAGCGLYLVVNGGGQRDADVTAGRAMFFEHDKIPVEEQLTLWQRFRLPEPTIQIYTGKKSIHSYWVFDSPVPIADWKPLQADLLEWVDADRTIKNPSRVMRLPGCLHQKTGNRCEIVTNSGQRYSSEELRAIVPQQVQPEPVTQTHRESASKPSLSANGGDLLEAVNTAISRLSPEQQFNWTGHDWQWDRDGKKVRGCCPWHESQSGTAFYIEPTGDDGRWLWRCPSCDVGGDVITYRHKLTGGTGSPKGKDFVAIAKQLCGEAGVAFTNQDAGVDEQHTEQPDFAKTYQQIVLDSLYSKTQWICLGGTLYERKHTHYQESPDEVELSRITTFLKTYITTKNNQKGAFHTNPSAAKSALEWVKYCTGVTPNAINPTGALNLKNGVLVLDWSGEQPTWKLEPHNPERWRFTYAPLVEYQPDADPEACNKLLEALEPSERTIYLRTLAAAIDLPEVRKRKGRAVKILLLWGDGNNGKDALRESAAALFGKQGLTSASLSDFQQYDQGRKFPLVCLEHSRINWSSENINRVPLDTLESLKLVATGDPITIERKGRDSYQVSPTCVCLFNLNGLPNIKAGSEAIRSRYAVLSLRKTFKQNADPSRGEVEADSRFKYSPDWVNQAVVPALLNKVLLALTDLIQEGIDYTPTDDTLEEIQRENSHLLQFCQNTHLQYCPGESVEIAEIWERLELWYLNNGYLEVEDIGTEAKPKSKRVWGEPPRNSDPLVKGANQVRSRFLRLFGKCKAGVKQPFEGRGKPIPVILGLSFAKTGCSGCSGEAKISQNNGTEGNLATTPSAESGCELGVDNSKLGVGTSDQIALSTPSFAKFTPSLHPVKKVGVDAEYSMQQGIEGGHSHPLHPTHPVFAKTTQGNSDSEISDNIQRWGYD